MNPAEFWRQSQNRTKRDRRNGGNDFAANATINDGASVRASYEQGALWYGAVCLL
jgi:hypothetical protein